MYLTALQVPCLVTFIAHQGGSSSLYCCHLSFVLDALMQIFAVLQFLRRSACLRVGWLSCQKSARKFSRPRRCSLSHLIRIGVDVACAVACLGNFVSRLAHVTNSSPQWLRGKDLMMVELSLETPNVLDVLASLAGQSHARASDKL